MKNIFHGFSWHGVKNILMNFSELKDKIITQIELSEYEIIFHTIDADADAEIRDKYKLYHENDCCEEVYVESIVGNISDIIGTPIVVAEESSNSLETDITSCTWTFYKIDTIKGGITIRWIGTSNGYYSESVDFVKMEN